MTRRFSITAVYLDKSVSFKVNATDRYDAHARARTVAKSAYCIIVKGA